MAFDPKAIREALADQIRGYIARSITVYPYKPQQPTYPYVAILSDDPYVSYHETFSSDAEGALCDIRLIIEIAQNAEALSAQIFVDDLLSSGTGRTSSVVDAVELDRSLGGVVDTCIALRAGPIVPIGEDGSGAVAQIPLQVAQRRT